MTKATTQKLALTPPQTIPLDKLVLHEGNVRQIKAGVSIESLAADIERRGLLQSPGCWPPPPSFLRRLNAGFRSMRIFCARR